MEVPKSLGTCDDTQAISPASSHHLVFTFASSMSSQTQQSSYVPSSQARWQQLLDTAYDMS